MTTRDQMLGLIADGLSYDQAAARLHESAGLLYMIATGIPADGTDSSSRGDAGRPGGVGESTQALSNPPFVNPLTDDAVRAWIEGRASRELTPEVVE